ncbi:hypothetical protein ACFXI6_05000, partial [Streptomyces mirabilis]|uniref:hypothetical protein n=1 Tax=Streptomyces mirabilis TaxID=68239 RepID=UPI0036925E81
WFLSGWGTALGRPARPRRPYVLFWRESRPDLRLQHALSRHDGFAGQRIDSTDSYSDDIGRDAGSGREWRQTPAERLWDVFGG